MDLPKIYQYLDFRKFLKDYYEAYKKINPTFTHRYIAEKGGFDGGLFTKVLTGKRNISLKMAFKFVEAFELVASEEEYFELLVLFDRAKTHNEKKLCLEKIIAFKKCEVQTLAVTQYEFYNKWYYSAIREVLFYFPFKENYEELAQQLDPPITVKQAKKSIKLLIELDLIQLNKKGFFEQTETLISSGYESNSVAVNNYVLKTMDLGKESMDRFNNQERNLSTITFGISHKDYNQIEKKIREFRHDLMNSIKDGKSEDRVYQLNMQLFPITKTHKSSSRRKK